jgi:hypothetical protein
MRLAVVALLLVAGCMSKPDAPRTYRIDNVKVSCKTKEFSSLPGSFVCNGDAQVKQLSGPTGTHYLHLEVLNDGKAFAKTVALVKDGAGMLQLYYADHEVAKGTEPKSPTFTFNAIGSVALQPATLAQ